MTKTEPTCCFQEPKPPAQQLTLALALIGLTTSAALAQSGPGTELDEVVVTAQKRLETLIEVPLSITAISRETIEQAGITNFVDYALKVPNLTFSYSNSQGVTESRSIAIRGVQGVNTTGYYLDDLPLPDGLDPQALNLQRIEVLRGPQGTLYGARSMGGTVRLITEEPDTTSFSAAVHGVASAMYAGGG